MTTILHFAGYGVIVFGLFMIVKAVIITVKGSEVERQAAADLQIPSFRATRDLQKQWSQQFVHTEHDWRYITEFVRQCRERRCAKVEFIGQVPDGMTDYVRLLTSVEARTDPDKEAAKYAADVFRQGIPCKNCRRLLPDDISAERSDGQKYCPYCRVLLEEESSSWG